MLIKDKLNPPPSYVSVWDGIRFQLADRVGDDVWESARAGIWINISSIAWATRNIVSQHQQQTYDK